MIVMWMTEDTARVVANACDHRPFELRDGKIAYQVAGVLRHALMPDEFPQPMRTADEPMPIVEVSI